MTKEQPNDPVSQMRLGEAYEKQGASDKAAAAFEQALKLNPKLASGVTKLAQLYAGPLREQEKALAYAKRARELAPADPQIAGLLGKVAYESGNFTWSYSLLQEAARQRQNDPALLSDLAWSAYSLGRVNEARDAMQKALTNKPDPDHAADAQKFLALTALSENPKDLWPPKRRSRRNYSPIPNLCRHSWPKPRWILSKVRLNGQPKPTTIFCAAGQNLRPRRNASLCCAQDPSMVAAAYDLATKARKTLPDDPELTELLGTIELRKKGISAGRPVVTGERSETAAGRQFSFLSGNVSAPDQAKA